MVVLLHDTFYISTSKAISSQCRRAVMFADILSVDIKRFH